jgi:hypothetical protein
VEYLAHPAYAKRSCEGLAWPGLGRRGCDGVAARLACSVYPEGGQQALARTGDVVRRAEIQEEELAGIGVHDSSALCPSEVGYAEVLDEAMDAAEGDQPAVGETPTGV